MTWTQVDDDGAVKEGDRLQQVICVHAPDVPFDEVIAQLSVSTAELTGQLNNELPDCIDVVVEDRTLERSSGVVVDGNECEFLYTVEYRVTRVGSNCEGLTYGAVALSTLAAIAGLVLIGIGVSFALVQLNKFAQQPGGGDAIANTSTALLLVAGAWAFSKFSGED